MTIRARPETLEQLREFRDRMQAVTPFAVTLDDALRIAVGSASAALVRGELPVALSAPPFSPEKAA